MKLCTVISFGPVLRSELPDVDVDVDADSADDEDEVARCCKRAHTYKYDQTIELQSKFTYQ